MALNFGSILTLSDVSVGYGTPQVVSISRSLAATYGAECLLLEPDQPERPPLRSLQIPGVRVERVYTATHPYTLSGQTEYCIAAAERIDREKPDVIVLCSFLGAGAILRMKHTPKCVMYYALEHTDDTRVRERSLFKAMADRIDVVIFPEENRAQLEKPRIGLEKKPSAIVYNGSDKVPRSKLHNKRNGSFFYGGLLHPEFTLSENYFSGGVDAYPIDLYGLIDGYPDRDEPVRRLIERNSRVRYHGYLSGGDDFLELLSEYNYSIVMWAPINEAFLYAAPNKLFDAIAAGVPPIAAPHPLCIKLIRRYRMGFLTGGWAPHDLKLALEVGRAAYLSGEFAEIIEHRLPIAAKELGWDAQFEKVIALLEAWDE